MPDDAAAVLVSLHPGFAQAISEGSKTVELRRRFPDIPPGTWLVVYVTQPVGAVVGMVRIEAVVRAPIERLWCQVRCHAGISEATFFDYFSGCSEGTGVFLGERRAVGPFLAAEMDEIIPGFRPPQSFRYVERSGLAALERSAAASRNQRRFCFERTT